MKKIALTFAIILGLSLTSFANPDGGGLFGRGENPEPESNRLGGAPALPAHGQTNNQNAPVGSGTVALVGFGAVYLVAKRCREE